MLGKIAALAAMHKTIPTGTPLFQRLLAGLAAVLAFAVTAALLAGALIIGASYYAYNALIAHGLDADAAFFSVGFIILFLCVALLISAVAAARSLISIEAPLTYRTGGIINAFIDGLLTHKNT